jgi:hypothetical protein
MTTPSAMGWSGKVMEVLLVLFGDQWSSEVTEEPSSGCCCHHYQQWRVMVFGQRGRAMVTVARRFRKKGERRGSTEESATK